MRKFLLGSSWLLSIAVFLGSGAIAQDGSKPNPEAQARIQKFKERAAKLSLPTIKDRTPGTKPYRTDGDPRKILAAKAKYLRTQVVRSQAYQTAKEKNLERIDLTTVPKAANGNHLTKVQKQFIKANRPAQNGSGRDYPLPLEILPEVPFQKRSGDSLTKSEDDFRGNALGTNGSGPIETWVSDTFNFASAYRDDMYYVSVADFYAPAAAEYISLKFNFIDMEDGYDYIFVLDQWGNVCDEFTGSYGPVRAVACEGNYAEVVVYSDEVNSYSVGYDGFYITGYYYGFYPTDPVAIAYADSYWDDVGGTIYFDGADSYSTNPNGYVRDYWWDFGDGYYGYYGAYPYHRYDRAGTYRVTLRVTDNLGYWAEDSFAVVIYGVTNPRNLRVTQTNYRSLSFAWDPSPDGDNFGYRVQLVQGSTNNASCSNLSTDLKYTTSYTRTDLTPGTLYTLKVCAYNQYGLYSNGLTITAGTKNPPPTPIAPPNFRVTGATNNSIAVAWDPSGGSTTGYVIGMGVGTSFPACGTGVQLSSGVTTYTFNGLTEGTDYKLTICAFNDATIYSSPSNLSAGTTLPAPNAPTSFRAGVITGESVTTKFTSGGGTTSGFKIALVKGTVAPDCKTGILVAATDTKYTFRGLTPTTRYTGSICAVNKRGDYSSSLTLAVKTKIATPPAPTGLTVNGRTQTSLGVKWTSAGGTTSGFKAAIKEGTVTPGCGAGVSLALDTVNYSFSGLKAGTVYKVAVCAVNLQGVLSAPATLELRTKSPLSPPPSGFTSTGKGMDFIATTWVSGGGSTSKFALNIAAGTTAPSCKSGVTVSRTTLNYTFSGLAANTLYTMVICSKNIDGVYSSPVSLQVTTLATDVAPPAPTNLMVTGSSKSSISIQWKSQGGTTTGFKAAILQGSAAPSCSGGVAIAADAIQHSFSGLIAGKMYSISICAVSSTGKMSSAATVSGFTSFF